MQKTGYYNDIKEIQKIAWRGDDMLMQEDLFDLQDSIATLALKIAQAEKKTDDLVATFPYLYKKG